MRKLEIVLVVIGSLGVVLRFRLFTGSSEIIALDLMVLSLLYTCFSFTILNNIPLREAIKKSSYEGNSTRRIVMSVAIGFALSAVIIGVSFKMLLLPGAHEMLIIGLFPLAFFVAIIILRHGLFHQAFKSYYFRMFPMIVVGLVFYLIPKATLKKGLDSSYSKASIQSKVDPEYYRKIEGVNFMVVSEKDTLSHFYYRGHKKYEIVGVEDSLPFLSKELQPFQGKYILGVSARANHDYKYLSFKKVVNKRLDNIEDMSTNFMHEAYSLVPDYEVMVTQNYIDSLVDPIRKYETYAAVAIETRDTLLFQEVFYVFKENNMTACWTVYDNAQTREEMRLAFADAIDTITKSMKEK